MFTSRLASKTQQGAMTYMKRAMGTRVPMIKFTHGNREQIAKDIAATPQPSWFVTHNFNGAATSMGSASQRRAGPTVTHCGVTTRTTIMEDGFIGNPFSKGGMDRNRFSQEAMDLIEMGGVYP